MGTTKGDRRVIPYVLIEGRDNALCAVLCISFCCEDDGNDGKKSGFEVCRPSEFPYLGYVFVFEPVTSRSFFEGEVHSKQDEDIILYLLFNSYWASYQRYPCLILLVL